MAIELALTDNKAFAEKSSTQIESVRHNRKNINIKLWLIDSLLWLMLFALTVVGVMNIAAMKQYAAVSLRYKSPITGQTAYQVRQYAIEHKEENTFWPAFWCEDEAHFSTEYREKAAKCILFSGDGALVWPAAYLAGGAPGVIDNIGCAISSALAWELWGDTDVVGKTIEVDSSLRVVRGVFEEVECLALLSVPDEERNQSFSVVELSGGPVRPSRSEVESFIAASGLGSPDSVLMGTPTFLAEFMLLLPLIMLALYGLVLCIGWAKKWPAPQRRIFIFSMLVCAAVLLPGVLDFLPDWVIPTRWSDFSFWGSLFKQTGANLREYLMLSPSIRDVGYAILFFKQIGIAAVSSGLALSINFLLQRKLLIKNTERRMNRG